MKEIAFWDSSALVPLCIEQPATETAKQMSMKYGAVVWWATPVEITSSFARLWRMKQIDEAGLISAFRCLDEFRTDWNEIDPSSSLRETAEELPSRYGLRAADALQLAAALTWTMHRPQGRPFLSGDQRLLEAARQLGFHTLDI